MESKFTQEKPAVTSNGFHNKKFTSKYTNSHRINQSTIDYGHVKQKTMPHVLSLLNRVLPGGRIRGQEYIALNPRRYDRTPDSFRFNTRTGRWQDFSTKDKGGDIISLWAYVRGISQSSAAREILAIVGAAS